MPELRAYQIKPHEIAVEFFHKEKPKPSLIVAPTAFGKSHLIAHTARDIDGKTLVLQPTKELLEQNFEKFISLGGHATVYSDSMGMKKFSDVVYATIGSIKNIGDRFASRDFRNLIIDEPHLYPRESIPEPGEIPKSMLAKFIQASEIKKILGLTASPFKLQSNIDHEGNRFSKLQMLTSRSKFGQLFSDIIHVTQIQEITRLGYWAPINYEIHDYDGRTLEWNSQKSDYTEQSLFEDFYHNDLESRILDRLKKMHDRRSVLIFVPTVAIAESLARRIDGAAAVHGKTPDDIRVKIIKAFKCYEIKYVFNVNLLAVGFDHPGLDAIGSARPTSSLAWFYQALGRGTRPHPLKPNCLICDFVGNVDRFGRIEDIYLKKKKTWQAYGQGGRLLTNIAMDQIGTVIDAPVSGIVLDFGKYKGTELAMVPIEYIQYMLENFSWTDRNFYIKEACDQLMEHHRAKLFTNVEKK
jgi:DNA repair protein RadD